MMIGVTQKVDLCGGGGREFAKKASKNELEEGEVCSYERLF